MLKSFWIKEVSGAAKHVGMFLDLNSVALGAAAGMDPMLGIDSATVAQHPVLLRRIDALPAQ